MIIKSISFINAQFTTIELNKIEQNNKTIRGTKNEHVMKSLSTLKLKSFYNENKKF